MNKLQHKLFDSRPRITCTYEQHKRNPRQAGFPGVDFASLPYYGDPVYMPFDGWVQRQKPSEFKVKGANHSDNIAISCVEKKDGKDTGKMYTILHLKERNEAVMQSEIKAGTVVGWVGWSGYVIPNNINGTHSHVTARFNWVFYDPTQEILEVYDRVSESLEAPQETEPIKVDTIPKEGEVTVLEHPSGGILTIKETSMTKVTDKVTEGSKYVGPSAAIGAFLGLMIRWARPETTADEMIIVSSGLVALVNIVLIVGKHYLLK